MIEFWPLLYVGSYLFLLVLVVAIIWIVRKWFLLFWLLWVVILWVFVWGRFIEPNQLVVEETTITVSQEWAAITPVRLAVFADIHAGHFKDQRFVERIVQAIQEQHNTEFIDAVLIAWDFTGYPKKEQIERIFAPLSSLTMPVYAVLWNHDVEVPWDPMIREPLVSALTTAWVQFLHNDYIELQNLRLLWVGPYMSNEDDTWMLEIVHQQKDERPFVVLAHNPDSLSSYAQLDDQVLPDVTFAGHTHCGQVRLPLVYKLLYRSIVPTDWDFDCGLTTHRFGQVETQLFITPWVGETWIPMRWNNTPAVSLVTIE